MLESQVDDFKKPFVNCEPSSLKEKAQTRVAVSFSKSYLIGNLRMEIKCSGRRIHRKAIQKFHFSIKKTETLCSLSEAFIMFLELQKYAFLILMKYNLEELFWLSF